MIGKLEGKTEYGRPGDVRKLLILLAPQVRLELTTLRLTAECSAIELLRNVFRLEERTLRVKISTWEVKFVIEAFLLLQTRIKSPQKWLKPN